MFFSPDTPRQSPHMLARQQSLRARRKLVQVAGGYTQVYGIRQQPTLFLVTRPVTLNLANSIKCVGDSFLTRAPYYALLTNHTSRLVCRNDPEIKGCLNQCITCKMAQTLL